MSIIKKTLVLAVTLSLLLFVLTAEESEERCEQQFQSQRQLAPCKDYLRDSTQVGSDWREQFQQCCQLLDQMEEQCRCQGIRKALQEQQRQHQQLREEELREMIRTAESLPRLCRVGPQRCDIKAKLSQAASF